MQMNSREFCGNMSHGNKRISKKINSSLYVNLLSREFIAYGHKSWFHFGIAVVYILNWAK